MRWVGLVLMAVLAAGVALMFWPRSDDELTTAVRAGDLAAVQRLVAAAERDGEPVGTRAYFHALENLTPCNDSSVEIVRLIASTNPQPRQIGFSNEARELEFTLERTYTTRGHAPIEFATMKRCAPAIQALFDAGVRAESEGVRNALVYAAERGLIDEAKVLIANGADVNARGLASATSHAGPWKTPLEVARKFEQDEAPSAVTAALAPRDTAHTTELAQHQREMVALLQSHGAR